MPDTIRLSRPPRFGIRTLGFGSRTVIWTQGCTLACPGCVSRDTWSADAGTDWLVSDLVEAMAEGLATSDGLTVTGGEPFQQAAGLGALVAGVRRQVAAAPFDILSYSGHRIEELRRRHAGVLRQLDVVIDGRFRQDLPTNLPLRGSQNQRVHRLTELGRLRYVDADEPAVRPALQLTDTVDGLELAGIPGRGELEELERRLAESGLHLGGASWRP